METILKLGAEGGSLTLLGNREGEKWIFYRLRDESALADILDLEDQHLQSRLRSAPEPLGSELTTALAELTHCWTRMRPLVVHPEFQWTMYKEVLSVCPEDAEKWHRACTRDNPSYELARFIALSRNTVVLTGAGMSTESGLPDFRSKDGWWRNIDPRTVATVDALEDNYELFRDFYQYRIKTLQRYRPHKGHELLAKWEQEGRIFGIATQNVDGFHAAAGSVRVAELHGQLLPIRCHSCGKPAETTPFLEGKVCALCGGRLRPSVVLFGESLPEHSWKQALEWFQVAELVIVIGTSLQVAPANQLPLYTSGRTAYINLDIKDVGNKGFDFVIQGQAKQVLTELDEMLTFINDQKSV